MRGSFVTAAVLALALGAGCKKKPPQPAAATPPTVVAPPSTNYQAGGSAIGNALNAAKRVATQVELQNLGLLIYDAYLRDMKMPDEKSIMDQVKKTTPNLYGAYQDKTIIVCWTAQSEGLWAYQAGAETHGGLALVSPGQARRVTADEMRELLAAK